MDRFNRILHSDDYNIYLNKIAEYEKSREFCTHTIEHFLAVARIAYIMVLEECINVSKEVVYITALLHDIGRYKQYEDNTPHEEASWKIAKEFINNNEFTDKDKEYIKEGILYHRKDSNKIFGKVMFKADKASRECYRCNMYKDCNWKDELKNYNIKY